MRIPAIGSMIAVRGLAIVALLIFASQLAVILIVWRQAQARGEAEYRLPLPARIASIVETVEATPPDKRDVLLQALNGPNLAVRIEDRPASEENEGSRHFPAFRRAIERYSDVLADRQVIAMIGLGRHQLTGLREGEDALIAHFPMRLLIELKEGDWLVVETPDLLAARMRRLPFGFFGGFVGTLVAGLAVWTIWQEVRPVRDMATAARSFAQSGTPSPVIPAGGRDVRDLTQSFNDMQERIATLMANRTLVMSAMTHDVRTYLTRLRLRIEDLEPESRDAAERTINDIQALLDDTFAFAETGIRPDTTDPVDLARLLETIVTTGQFPEEKVHLDIGSRPVISGHAGRLQRALVNLISNAVKYGKEADIHLSATKGIAQIEIADRGPGIPPEDRQRVFDPFYRRDESRNRNVEGAGLGLAIAHNIVRNHGGTISLLDRAGGGLRVIVGLPLTPPGR